MKEFKPKLFKWKKYHNRLILRKLKQQNYKHFFLYKGLLGFKALKSNIIKSNELKTIFLTMSKICGREYKIWLYCYPNISFTSKSISVRMGKGIGSLDNNWLFCIKKNTIFLEFHSKSKEFLLEGLKSSKKKIRIPCKIIELNFKWYI